MPQSLQLQSELAPEHNLACAILRQVLIDIGHKSPSTKKTGGWISLGEQIQAIEWILDLESVAFFADLLGLEGPWLQRALLAEAGLTTWGSRSRRTENNDPWVNCRNCGEKRRSLSTYSVDKNSWFSPRLALNLTCESGFLPRSLSWILLPQRQGKECYLEANKYNCLQRIDVFCSFTPGTQTSLPRKGQSA